MPALVKMCADVLTQVGVPDKLYVGGSMVNLAAAATHSTASGLQINMYHGLCSWDKGQLEGVGSSCLLIDHPPQASAG